MKQMKRWIITFLLGLVAFLGLGTTVDARSLVVDKYDIEANILENGDVQFFETITFQSDGAYNGVFYNLDYSGFGKPTDVNAYLETSEGRLLMNQENSGKKGTYQLTDSGSKIQFKVYFPFSNSKLKVTFQYTIPRLVTNYLDTAELNRKVIGQEWEIDQRNITVKVNIPGTASRETLRAWGHGAGQNGDVKIASDYRSVTLTAPKNESGDFVEVHMLFPQTLTHANTNVKNEKAFDRIVAEEEKLINDEKNLRNTGFFGMIVGWVLLVLNMVYAFVTGFFANRKRLAQVQHIPDHLYELPEDITPAVMNQAVYGKTDMTDFSATVMDLVRKKVLKLSDTEPYTITLVDNKQEMLRHEKLALHLLFDIVGGTRKTIELEEVKKYAKNNSTTYYNECQKWMGAVDTAAEKYRVTRFGKDEPQGRSGFPGCLLVIIGALTIGAAFLTKNLNYLLWTVGGVLLVVGPLTLIGTGIFANRRSLEGELRYRKWQAFKQMLKDLSPMKRIEDLPSIQLWDHFLVYAISLGVAEHVIKVLKKLIPDQLPNSVFYSTQNGTIYYPVSDFNKTFTSSYNSANSSVNGSSNSGGFGGGFSGGSSGGSGGGSGGGGF